MRRPATANERPGIVCVNTQVIEAGVDISLHRLWSKVAPKPSMLQRLRRFNRRRDDQDARARIWPKEGRNQRPSAFVSPPLDFDSVERLLRKDEDEDEESPMNQKAVDTRRRTNAAGR
jgi:CRISPR/Cas system-associated endonuclease/helicase Cas3